MENMLLEFQFAHILEAITASFPWLRISTCAIKHIPVCQSEPDSVFRKSRLLAWHVEQ